MARVGDTAWVREDFLSRRPAALEHLLKHRFGWMNSYLRSGDRGCELGSGAAFSQFHLRQDIKVWHSDVEARPWLSFATDAMRLPFAAESLDFIIAVDTIHHLAKPAYFLDEVSRVLKVGGRLILKDVHASLLFRLVLKMMAHEGYAYDVDPLGREQACNDPSEAWSGNNALSDLLWAQKDQIHSQWGLGTIHHRYSESLMLYCSGGVSARSPVPTLPSWGLGLMQKLDNLLSRHWPACFPTGVQWVLEKQ